MYHAAQVNNEVFTNSTIDIEAHRCSIELPIKPAYFHALGAIHGAVYFKLLDDAAYFAAASVEQNYFIVTTTFNINLVRPVSKGRLVATGELIFKSGQILMAESKLHNEQGKLVAFGNGQFSLSKKALDQAKGYGIEV